MYAILSIFHIFVVFKNNTTNDKIIIFCLVKVGHIYGTFSTQKIFGWPYSFLSYMIRKHAWCGVFILVVMLLTHFCHVQMSTPPKINMRPC